MTISASLHWEYRVIHINVDNGPPPTPPTPEAASERLGGALSPDFIAREFPDFYSKNQSLPKHPAAQLQHFLNLLGQEGWEFIETAQVGPLLMFFFKRPQGPVHYSGSSS